MQVLDVLCYIAMLHANTEAATCGTEDQSVPNLRLHQVVALAADVLEEAEDVDRLLLLDLLEHAVDDDVGAGAAHAGAAKNGTREGGVNSPRQSNHPVTAGRRQADLRSA